MFGGLTRLKLGRSRASRLTILACGGLASVVLGFVLIEGLVSTLLFTWDIASEEVIPERRHTQHDSYLGWVGLPNVALPDMYGSGVYLRTNSRGFRGTREYTELVPEGKRRVICSGDSVTFGFGVDDDHSWCRLLESLDGRLETLNMSLPGYGVDQAYLWYKRDAGRFQHHLNVLAVITDDFTRMQLRRRHGYAKPSLAVEDGELVVRDVPVPKRRYIVPWLTEALQHVRKLRSWQAALRLVRKLSPPRPDVVNAREQNERTALVLSKLLHDLKQLNASRSSRLIVVYLPQVHDDEPHTRFWVSVLERECAALGIPLINLLEAFRGYSYQEAEELRLPGDPGHFSEKGNQRVANLVYDALRAIPDISRTLVSSDPR